MIDQSFRELVQALAAKTPTPGGGSAAGLQASLGVALALMALRFSRGKKKNLDADEELAATEEQLNALLERMQALPERDASSFDHVADAYRLPRETDAQRDIRNRAIDEAMIGAMVVPEETMCLVRDGLRLAAGIAARVGKNIVSDLAAGGLALWSALQIAEYNVRINASYLTHDDVGQRHVDRVGVIREEARGYREQIETVVEALLPRQ